MKDTLTKENFWDEMEQKYPKAMKHFKEWINNYKTEHDWNGLFKDGVYEYTRNNGQVMTYKAPKYHELPIAMQFGIFLEWFYASSTALYAPLYVREPKNCISWVLNIMEVEL